MGRRHEPAWAKGTLGLSVARERGDIHRQFQNRLMVTRSMIDRLGLEQELHGHTGCVNCLEWNEDGSILASASDDLHVILWDPFRYRQIHNIATGHSGNIFSVKFLSRDTLATCAADSTVHARSLTTGASLLQCSCHCGRVKRLATAPQNPHLIWSAGEDGLILQHDLRAPHRCDNESSNVLINLLNHLGRYAEAKCVAVNPRRPYQLAVGANDFFVRLYDTRMIKMSRLQAAGGARGSWERQSVRCARAGRGDPDNNIPRQAVAYYAPGHLSLEPNEPMFPKKATTYVSYSHDGNEILVNLGSEQIYLFDINAGRRPVLVESFVIQHNHGNRDSDKAAARNGTLPPSPTTPPPPLPSSSNLDMSEKIRLIKEMAHDQVSEGNYSAAVALYNDAIAACRSSAVLHSHRAAALMRRAWAGDTYAAIMDCYAAIKLDPSHVKSHFKLAKGLMDLKKAREAHECLLYFKDKFPRHSSSHAVFLLQKDIDLALKQRETQPDEVGSSSSSSGGGGSGSGGAGDTSLLEREARAHACDYERRFVGHCNTTTDIKEANFLGPDANFIAAGSDDGSLFIWCRQSGNIVRCLRGDESIVNCVQLHPSVCVLATSGIEAVVRVWAPRGAGEAGEGETEGEGEGEARRVRDPGAAAAANQARMRSDPFESMILNISFAPAPDRDMPAAACRAT